MLKPVNEFLLFVVGQAEQELAGDILVYFMNIGVGVMQPVVLNFPVVGISAKQIDGCAKDLVQYIGCR
ncbi:hypothetical protein D3C87_1769310 [compost metagenome]